MSNTINLSELRALFVALHAGDSLGATSEFMSLPAVREEYKRHSPKGWPFVPVGDGPFRWAPGGATDDTQMAVALLESLDVASDVPFDPDRVGKRFVAWLNSGPPDVGATCRKSIRSFEQGRTWEDAAYHVWDSHNAANGSLMRNGIIPALSDKLDEVFDFTVQQAMLTHYGPMPTLCCLAQSWIIWHLLSGHRLDMNEWVTDFFDDWHSYLHDPVACNARVRRWYLRVEDHYAAAVQEIVETDKGGGFSTDWSPFNDGAIPSQGYALSTLQVGVWALNWYLLDTPMPDAPKGFGDAFKRTGANVLGWVALIGKDSDTYGAVAGPMIAAAMYPEPLPDTMTANLEKVPWFDEQVWHAK